MENESYMKRAVYLAKQGEGYTSPNPMVGAVIVKDGKIIGEGYHHRAGEPHAERNALANCSESPAGSALYVTLEPCCHHGKTPPCTEAIIEAGISHVYIGSADPNPLVSGKGVRLLREHGIKVTEGFLKEECDAVNPVFFHYITKKNPYVALKYAMTADGKIATAEGHSRWISGEESRAHAHRLRHKYSGIMAGIETVLQDDPLLNCRMENAKQPVRIICDSRLRIPLESQICKTAAELPTIIAYCHRDEEKERALEALGISLYPTEEENGRVSLTKLMQHLGAIGMDSVLAEGGGEMHYSLLRAGLGQKLYVYLAPKIFGGRAAKTPVGGEGVILPENAFGLAMESMERLGEDILIQYKIGKGGTPCSQA